MNQTPLVSIVLPTYNGAKYLEQSIRSCLNQTCRNWELIIVDDASTDGTAEKLAELSRSDSRIQVIRHATNQKLPAALNTGFAQVRGTYLTWTSDDNLFRPQALAEMVAFLETNPRIGLVYTDYSLINESGEETQQRRVAESDQLYATNTVGPSFMYRRKVMEEVGEYARDLFLAEDYDYWLRVSARFQLAALHQDLYRYRLHPQSLTSSRRDRIHHAEAAALFRNLPRLDWVSDELKAEAFLRRALRARNRGQFALSARLLAFGLRYSTRTVIKQLFQMLTRRHLDKSAEKRAQNQA